MLMSSNQMNHPWPYVGWLFLYRTAVNHSAIMHEAQPWWKKKPNRGKTLWKFRVSSLQQCCSALHNQFLKIIKGVIHHPSCTVDFRHRRAEYKATFEHFNVSVTFAPCITNTCRDNYMNDLALIRINTFTIDVLLFPDSVRRTEGARPSRWVIQRRRRWMMLACNCQPF